MSEQAKLKRHSVAANVFHWGFLLVFVYGLSKQVGDVEELNDAALLQFEIRFAYLFLALLGARYVFMRLTRPTALPENASARLKLMVRVGHLVMYVSLALIAVSGLIIGYLFGAGGEGAFGMGAAVLFHEAAIFVSLASIAGHIVAAIYHRIKGDGIWSTMVPVWIEK